MTIGLIVSFVLYVNIFKSDFKQEDFDKAMPFLILVSAIYVVLVILSSVLRG